MIIEQNTNYAYKLKYMDNPTFDKVRDLSTKFYRELPQALQDELFDALNRGIDILDSEPQMTAYLFAFGKMHQAKLNYAFDKLPKEFFEQPEINIIDYGCGQALGTMCYADFLRENGYAQNVKAITLIEPSEICLKRAALHASVFFPDTEIKTVNKKFDDLTQDDIVCNEETPTLHVLSNVLDMLNFNLDRFAELVKGCLKGYNQFVCVGPYFNKPSVDHLMDDFAGFFEGKDSFNKIFDKYQLNPEKSWTAHKRCFSVGELEEELTTEATNEEIENGIKDEYGVVYSRDGKRLLECRNSELREYTIKNGTRVICNGAFSWRQSLQQITLPNSVTSIGNSAFSSCESLQQITIPDSVTSIGNSAFSWCKSLQQITISNSVTSIGNWAFGGCRSLRQITIPDSVTSIGSNPFRGCHKLTLKSKSSRFIVTEEGLLIDNQLDNIISYDGKAQYVTIPDSVTSIGNDAFGECESLQQITIPDSVTSIGNCAFSCCRSLQQITIPDSVTSIDNEAFSWCESLQQITIPDSVTSIGEWALKWCESLQQIIIPKGSMEKFKKMLDEELWDKLVEQ